MNILNFYETYQNFGKRPFHLSQLLSKSSFPPLITKLDIHASWSDKIVCFSPTAILDGGFVHVVFLPQYGCFEHDYHGA
jgi:hypothetical protein